VVDAKHRLAYILTRSALLDLERGRREEANSRAREALEYAGILERATEILLARVALALVARDVDDPVAYQQQLAAIRLLDDAPVATWARQRAGNLLATS